MAFLPLLLSAVAKVSRPMKKGDITRNARRRFERAAERNIKKSKKNVGEVAKRYEELARYEYEQAARGYESRAAQEKFLQRVKRKTGFDIEIESIFEKSQDAEVVEAIREKYSKRSLKFVTGRKTTREELAEQLLSNPLVARRVYGGTVEIWRGKTTYSERNEAILEYFEAQDMLEVIERFEDLKGLYDRDVSEREDAYNSIILRAIDMIRELNGRGNAQA